MSGTALMVIVGSLAVVGSIVVGMAILGQVRDESVLPGDGDDEDWPDDDREIPFDA